MLPDSLELGPCTRLELGSACYPRLAAGTVPVEFVRLKKRIAASLGFRSVEGAWRTIEGYEAMHAIRKGQVRWVAKGDAIAQRDFIHPIFGIAA